MSFIRRTRKFFGGGLIALALTAMTAVALAGQVTGAIFTTLFDGSAVNHNIYAAKMDVYLNGGPHAPSYPCTAAGLPDGEYYFQVTDPSGKKVLSVDDIAARRLEVTGGIITAYLGGTHITGVDMNCGGITVQLYPFYDTPNPGGEYKVWMTPVDDYHYNHDRFLPSKSKTDNFKAPADDAADTDNDGLTNGAEFGQGTNPNNPDTDGDGAMDGQEVVDDHTDPLNPDTDGDGFPDGSDDCPTDITNTCSQEPPPDVS